jgi:outer membrane lipoprotein carrier protein
MSNFVLRNTLLLVLVSCLTLVNTAWADLQQDVAAVQKRYRNLTSLSFAFQQTTGSNRRARKGAGNCIFYRPTLGKAGIMRWNYTAPDVQIIVNDGKKLSIYTQKDKQVLVSSAADLESDITYSLFAGNRSLLDDFSVQPADSRFAKSGKLEVVQLIPKKPHGQIKTVHCWFDSNAVIHKLVLEDHFDTLTQLEFSNIKFNTLPANSAKVDVPKGTEVVRQ